MNQKVFLMEPDLGSAPGALQPTPFVDLNVKERQHLEEWIKQNPEILGEKFLLIAAEFDKFDKSDKRLDLLMLDRGGRLAIVELKRDAAGSQADLQALRYAAFCSTMTFEEVATSYAKSAGLSDQEAKQKIVDFLGDPDYSRLPGEPRIVLAAGSFDDPEITSCVLWLRKFGVDITCVEITPYRMADSRLLLIPRVLIPLPEAKDYLVRVERKSEEEAKPKRVSERDLLEMAHDRGVSDLLEICRRLDLSNPLNAYWDYPLPVYGGSFLYWVVTEKGSRYRSVFGINVSGARKSTPDGQLDVWIPVKNLAEAVAQREDAVRGLLKSHFQVIAEQEIDYVIRLRSVEEAMALITQIQDWSSVSRR